MHIALVAAVAAAVAVGARPALAHPLHTSLAEMTQKANGEFTISLRVFADDFLRHSGAPEPATGGGRPDARIVDYLRRTFVVIDRNGRGLPLKWCGSSRVSDLLVICLSGRISGGLRGARVRYSVLTDLFPDQINVLQIATGSGRQNLLFTPGETTRMVR